ncbi:MAG: hypothetical protein QNJ11_08000 [Woeseiaceae bacterium]|nr:hypothetical protein [Woeseiaceae bacterium]
MNHYFDFTFIKVAIVVLLSLTTACSSRPIPDGVQPADAPQSASLFTRLVDPSGCVIEQVTAGDSDQYQVQGVSTDGKSLLMAVREKGAPNLDSRGYEMDLATGEKTDLSAIFTNSGTYSPDGQFIVVAQESVNGKTDIYEYERATGELQPVAPHEDWDWLPSYSPDGRFILFNSYRVDGQSDIHVFEKSTRTLRRLTEYPGYDAHAQYSPDGERIVFNRQQGTREDGGYVFDLIVIDVKTGQETRLTDGEYEEGYPAWGPDGRHIVYSSDIDDQPGKPNLYILKPGGKGVSRITEGDWKDSYAFWTRDGAFIYFNSDRSGASNIYRLLMDGFECVRDVD